MGGMVLPHHQISPSPLRKAGFASPFALHKDGLLFSIAPRLSFLRPHCATVSVIRSEANGNGAVLPDAVRKYSKEELISFFRDIQTSIAESSPKASRRTKKPSPEPFQEVDKRRQSYGMDGDGSADDFSEERERAINLEDMKMAELRELARARRMRGYSKLKKGELIDRLRGVIM